MRNSEAPCNFIYALIDPKLIVPRYVGKTFNLRERFQEHMRIRRRTHRDNWIRKLKSVGLAPMMQILAILPPDEKWQDVEQEYIRRFRAAGYPLVNGTDGGDGTSGWHHSDETRSKISKSNMGKPGYRKGQPRSAEVRKKIGDAQRGKPRYKQRGRKVPDDVRAKISASHMGMTVSIETRKKIADKLRGRKRIFTAEHRKHISEAKKGVSLGPTSPEVLRKRILAMMGHTTSPETREKIRQSLLVHTVSEETREKIRATYRKKRLEREKEDAISDGTRS